MLLDEDSVNGVSVRFACPASREICCERVKVELGRKIPTPRRPVGLPCRLIAVGRQHAAGWARWPLAQPLGHWRAEWLPPLPPRRRRAIPCALGTACRRWGRPDRGGLRKGRCCDSGHRAGGHGEWRHESWGVRPQDRGHGARRERRRPRWCCCAIARALCARGGWKDSARCALRRRKYCRCNGGDSGRRHAWRRLERRGIRSQRRARVRLNTLLDEEV